MYVCMYMYIIKTVKKNILYVCVSKNCIDFVLSLYGKLCILILRFSSPRSVFASKLHLLKISVISKLRRFSFSLHRMFRSSFVSASIRVVNTKMLVQS